MTVNAWKASLDTAGRCAGIALLCLVPFTASAKDGPYLTWGAKTASVQQAGSAGQVPVPPSPYGQVGDPYLHVLNWGAKSGNPQPQPPNPPYPQPAPRAAEPVQAYAPPRQTPVYQPAPQYRAQPMTAPVRPQPVQSQAAAPMVHQPALAVQSQPKTAAQAPIPTPAQAPVASAANDGAYQVPASSPYAARIAAARAAQAKAEQPKTAKPANASQASQDQAAVTETPADDDKPFVPGEHYTDASEAPRLYSLHRGYGLKPDPITVDNNPSGAVLDTSHLDAAEAKAAKADTSDTDDDTSTDSVPAKSTDAPKSDAPSASGTQNASAGKTEKTSK